MAQSLSFPSAAACRNPRTTAVHRRFPAEDALTSSCIPLRLSSRLTVLSKTKLLSIKCRQSDYFEESSPSFSLPQKDPSLPRLNPTASPTAGKVFVGHSIYKGKAVLNAVPIPPEFTPLESGKFRISKEGSVLLEFAPASGLRQYDWSRKQVFSLSVNEIGTLISLGSADSCEFFHDPYMGRSDEGKIKKVLKVQPLPDRSGHSFSLSVQNKLSNIDDNIYIPISKAEFTVIAAAFKFILPYLIGWHIFGNSIGPDVLCHVDSTNANSRASAHYEWSR